MDKKRKSCIIFNLKTAVLSIFVLFTLSFANTAFAILYAPGATLNPTCLPTDTNCDVQFNIFSSSPLHGSGTSTDPFTISQASSTGDGYLSSTDWNIFNNKLSSTTLDGYLSTTTAASTYLTQIGAAFTYVTQPWAYTNFPTFSYASSTFATISSLNSYISTTSAATNYISTSTAVSTYPSFTYASSTFATISSLNGYLSTTTASSTYLSLATATSTYVSFNYASTTYLTLSSASTNYVSTSSASSTYAKLSGAIFTGNISASNFSGTSTGINTGDESSSTIRTKLGFASSTNDGYLSASDWTIFNNKLSTTSASATYLTIANASNTYLPLSASTSLAYISFASSSLYYLNSNPAGYITSTSTAFIPSASSSLYYLNTNPAGYITATTSALTNYVSTSTLLNNYPSYTYASSTYYLASNPDGYLTSFTETDPIWMAASSSYVSHNYASSTFATIDSLASLNTYLSTTSAAENYVSTSTAASTYVTYTYGSSTYYLASNPDGYISSYTETDPLWSAASSSYLSTTTASSTYAKLSGATFIGNISALNFSGTSTGINTGDESSSSIRTKLGSASSTNDGYLSTSDWTIFNNKVSTSSANSLYVTYDYASTTFPSFEYASNTFATISSLGSLNSYLSTTTASTTYLKITDATSKYFPIASSTEVLNTANFSPIWVPGSVTYDANVIANYNFENNGNDSVGSYNLTTVGTGPVFKTDLVKQGTYSYSVQNHSNAYVFSTTTAQTMLGSLSQWDIQGWMYVPNTSVPNVWVPFLSMNWGGAGGLTIALRSDGSFLAVYINGTIVVNGAAISYTTNAWHLMGVQWSGTQYKVYVDGTLVATYTSSVNVFTSPSDVLNIANDIAYIDTYNASSRIDKMLVSNIVRNGVEQIPADTSAWINPKIYADASGDVWAKNLTTAVNLTSPIWLSTSTASSTYAKLSGATFIGNISALNFSGTSTGINTGDESSSSIRTKLGSASSTNDGYLSSADWATFSSGLSTTSANSLYVNYDYASSTFPSFEYASNTFLTINSAVADYVSTSSLTSTLTAYLSTTSAETTFAKLDGTNQPFTGNINISTSSPELRLTDGGYTRLIRTSTDNQVTLYNKVAFFGSYTTQTFTSNGTATIPAGIYSVEVLAVGGGGGGGTNSAGGGGGGQVIDTTISITPGTYPVVVGNGGTTAPTSGTSSSFASITAIGGTYGIIGPNVGTGGTSGNGYLGGNGAAMDGGGGGGASQNGSNGVGGQAGKGGDGISSSISGTAIYYGGGGGGGGYIPWGDQPGAGGLGGGGNGAGNGNGTSGTTNTGGGGGGGAGGNGVGGAGGSGIVILKYANAPTFEEIAVLNSQDSTVAGEKGVNTFGADLGATHLDGNALYFDINGTTKLKVDSNGNLGIGTTTPSQALTVAGNIYATGTITASNFTGTSTGINTGDESSSSIRTKLGSASSTNDGYLSASDWTLFNGKLSTSTASSTYLTIANATSTYLTYSYASSTYASTTYLNNNFPTFSYASSTYLTLTASTSLPYLLYSSSTEKLNAANFVPVLVSGAVTYDVHTLASYNFEGNGNDLVGGYNLNQTGTPPFQTNTYKDGTHSLSYTGGNYFKLPASLVSTLGTKSQWTIEYWFYVSRDSVWNHALLGAWTHENTNSIGWIFRSDAGSQIEAGYGGAYSTVSDTSTGWHFISMQWDGTQAKYYMDGGTPKFTFNNTNNVFAGTPNTIYLMTGLYADGNSTNSRMDKLVVSDVVRNGVETISADTSKYIAPKIGADSNGNLYVQSVNGNSVAGSSQAGVSGFFGIGTTTPKATLDVYATNPSASDIFGVSSSSNARLFTITSAGNVGIGTSTPSTNLQVQGGLRLTGSFFDSTNATGTPGMILTSTGTSTLWSASTSLPYLLYSSSTEKLNAANFVPVLVSGAVTYDGNTLANYNFENNGNDSVGSYNLVATGTGPVFKTDLVKQGTYSYSVQVGANHDTFPTSLMTTLGASSQWTVEGWMNIVSGQNTFIANGWIPTAHSLDVFYTLGGWLGFYYDTQNVSSQPAISTGWHFFSVQWSSTQAQAKLYIDGTLYSTINSSVNAFSSPPETNTSIGYTTTYTSFNAGSRIDKMVVSNTLRNGVETIPADTSAYIAPKIGADSQGNLYIQSVNGTTVPGSAQSGVSGFFGIGTTTPSATLDVYATNPSSSDIFGVSSSSLARLFTITSAGNVGIGTSTPNQLLTVWGNERLNGALFDGANASGTLGQILSSTGTSTLWIASTSLPYIPSASSSLFALLTGTNQPFTGNINIATTSAELRLTDGNYTRIVRTSTNNQANLYNQVAVSVSDGTGGTITHSGGYTIHTFSATGTATFTPAVGSITAQALVVAGGGAGATGGGGAGGVISTNTLVISGTQTITVGTGGVGRAANSFAGNPGGNSSIGSLATAIGGGGGQTVNVMTRPATGGSGGGGAATSNTPPALGGLGTAGQGYNGGDTLHNGSTYPASGGGGAGEAGHNSVSNSESGAGGYGIINPIVGSTIGQNISGSYWVGGGGGGQGNMGGTPGAGGNGGGATGGGNLGTANTGGGGGGATGSGTGGTGGTGVVIIKYSTSNITSEISLISSQDSTLAGEYGVNTFGATNSATHLNGDALYFDINGTNKAIFDANGNLGIGTSTPAYNLDVVGTINASNGIYINGVLVSTLVSTSSLIGITQSVSPFLTALGVGAGATTTGGNDTFIGYKSGNKNTTGSSNTANGGYSLYSNTAGSSNTANGYQALLFNTTGSSNTANGMNALQANTTGTQNTANGGYSLYSNTAGFYNTANGYLSLYYNTTGSNNTTNGYRALLNTLGSNNIGLGAHAGEYETGTSTLYIDNLDRGSLANGKSQSLIYGVSSTTIAAQTLTFNANVGIGTTTSVYPFQVYISSSIEGHVATSNAAWTTTSDFRLKQNISTLEDSTLEKLMQLRAVRYDSLGDTNTATSGLKIGFIAQELEQVYPGFVDTNSITGYKSVAYSDLVPILLKGIQEVKNVLGDISTSTEGLTSLIDQIKTESERSALDFIMNKINSGAKILTDFVATRITAIRGYFDEVFAKKVHTEQICLKKADNTETCIDGDKLQNILDQIGVEASPIVAPIIDTSTSTATTTELVATSTATTTIDTSTTTPVDTSTSTASTTPDTISPVITINGENPVSVMVGDTYNDLGATALDDTDGIVPVKTTGTVDTLATGTYMITYSASDIAGNSSSADRIINVNE